jgi:polyhydroxybutyrate depolymerase
MASQASMPVMHVHSVDDPIALYEGGLARILPGLDTRVLHPAVQSMLKKWISHDGCPREGHVTGSLVAPSGSADAGQTATRITYGPCRGGAEVVLWKLTGAGHVWPGGRRDFLPWLLGTSSGIIDANREIWDFFSRFRRDRRHAMHGASTAGQ